VASGRAALAYERVEGQKSSIWIARANGSHARRIARLGYSPSLSPNGRWLTYAIPTCARCIEAVVRLVDLRRGISKTIGNVGVAWSPDSRRLALRGDAGISVLDVRSGRRRRLVLGRSVSLGGFSPDGKAITYVVDNGKAGKAYRSDVFVVRLADRDTRRLTKDHHSDDPTWGGDWIAYRRYHFSNEWSIGTIRVMTASGMKDRLIARSHANVHNAEQGIEPVELSADGKHLAACLAFEFGCPPAAFTIPDGRRVRLSFHRNPRTLSYPDAISRDGTEILVTEDPFESNLGYHVYVVPFGGAKTRLLLNGARSPDWVR
jgi:WD40-like Beta Propeller Repeat